MSQDFPGWARAAQGGVFSRNKREVPPVEGEVLADEPLLATVTPTVKMKLPGILRVPAGALLIAAVAGLCFAARGAQDSAAAKKQPTSGCATPDTGVVASCTSAELSAPIPSALDDTVEGTDELDDESSIEAAVVEEVAA